MVVSNCDQYRQEPFSITFSSTPDTDIDVDMEEGTHQESLSDMVNPENSLATDQLEAVVYRAIDDLAEDLKVAVTLRELEGLSYEEIAEVMDCPVGTVRSRIFRAREAIEKKIAGIEKGLICDRSFETVHLRAPG